MSSKTIKGILDDVEQFGYTLGEPGDYKNVGIDTDQALLQIQEIINECIGEDEDQIMPLAGIDNYKAVERLVGRNQARNEIKSNLEKRLK